jgi:DNA-binding winged helix-turn-helix (wHTH) protein
MARRTGSIATREQLYGEVWGVPLAAGDRSVDVYVSRLREKLRRALPGSRFIHTHPGFGYRFEPTPERLAGERLATPAARRPAGRRQPAQRGRPAAARAHSRDVHNGGARQ